MTPLPPQSVKRKLPENGSLERHRVRSWGAYRHFQSRATVPIFSVRKRQRHTAVCGVRVGAVQRRKLGRPSPPPSFPAIGQNGRRSECCLGTAAQKGRPQHRQRRGPRDHPRRDGFPLRRRKTKVNGGTRLATAEFLIHVV